MTTTVMNAWRVPAPRSDEHRSAGTGRRAECRAPTSAVAGCRARLRRVPYRPARQRGRPARAPARRHPGTRGRRRRRRAWARMPATFAAGDRVGIAWLRHTCGLCRTAPRGGEPVPGLPLHRLGRRRRLRRIRHRPCGLRSTSCRPATPTTSSRRCCAPASSATAPCGAPGCRRAAGSGIYGFGASAHITAQVALAQGAEVHVHDPGRAPPATSR